MATAMKHKQRSRRSHRNKQALKDHAFASFARFNFIRSLMKGQGEKE